MIFYVKLGRVRGLSVELSSMLGIIPVYKRISFRCETIVDMPYMQIIYTSGRWSPVRDDFRRSVANDREKNPEDSENPTGTYGY